MRQFGFGACLADDMGLGKTIQLIAYLLHVKNVEAQATPSLIGRPTSVLGNWQKELERFSPHLNVVLHYGANRAKGEEFTESIRQADVVLTSYGLSHLDFDEFESIEWSTIALDEIKHQKCRNKAIKGHSEINWPASHCTNGTPMKIAFQNYGPSLISSTTDTSVFSVSFKRNILLPLKKDGSEKKIHELQRLIKPFLLRRTKKDPEVELNLPDKLEQKEYCSLTPEQAALYQELVQDTFGKIETLSTFERKGLILQMLNKLKSSCAITQHYI